MSFVSFFSMILLQVVGRLQKNLAVIVSRDTFFHVRHVFYDTARMTWTKLRKEGKKIENKVIKVSLEEKEEKEIYKRQLKMFHVQNLIANCLRSFYPSIHFSLLNFNFFGLRSNEVSGSDRRQSEENFSIGNLIVLYFFFSKKTAVTQIFAFKVSKRTLY